MSNKDDKSLEQIKEDLEELEAWREMFKDIDEVIKIIKEENK